MMQSEDKLCVVVLFGGMSSEHEVSRVSAGTFVDNLDRARYEVLTVGITREGRWLCTEATSAQMADGSWEELPGNMPCVISPDRADHGMILFTPSGQVEKLHVDVVIPALHGLWGEDGTVQGLLELAGIPYVGCGVLASAVSMDKLYTKLIVDSLGIRQADYVPVRRSQLQDMDSVIASVENKLSYPVFVKPSNAGSSRGVNKADNREELVFALNEAAKHDRKILVEETIIGHEVECAVFGGGLQEVKASGVGEIMAAAEFYDFDAKYYNAESKTVVDPELPGHAAEDVRKAAVEIFKAVDGYGLSRVDFFVTDAGEVVFNEINTLPGFTAISMYPMLWEARGISKSRLVDDLINHAKERYDV